MTLWHWPVWDIGRMTIGDYLACRDLVDRHLDSLDKHNRD